ncbi:MAG: TIGR00288 family NYN domain-containing protein [Candidatus Micrarchaeota archaeon]|nr:TIGR00288 family NYN domain-containing protein [Candidatus Micrarchaeota archaeon]
MCAGNMLDKIKSILQRKKKDRNIALLIDGPNVIRKDVRLDLVQVRKSVEQYGQIKVAKIFLDQYASDKLIEAMTNQGYEPIITTGDVDVTMAVEAMVQVYNPHIQAIALMTRDIDFRPVLVKAKELGKETIVVGSEPGFSVALRNTADIVIIAQQR